MQKYTLKSENSLKSLVRVHYVKMYCKKKKNIKNWIIKSCCAIDIYFYIYLTKL